MTKDEALQLALDSMKEIIHWYAVRDRNDVFLNFVDQNPEIQKIMKSITAIKEALETKDEPVAWMNRHGACKTSLFMEVEAGAKEEYTIPVYAQPQRTWVGLTDEDMNNALDYWSDKSRSAYGGAHAANGEYVDMIETWRYIEAKLKELNT